MRGGAIVHFASGQLRFLTLNMCGLKSKLLIPEFQFFLFNFDIISLQETYCDDYDTLELEGYIYIYIYIL